MKPSKRKSVSKSSTTETKCDCADNVILGVVLTALAVIAIVLAYNLLSGPKYEVGDCLLNRVGETLEVRDVSTALETYTLSPQKYVESWSGFVTIRDYDKFSVDKDIEFVDEEYIEVPCSR